MAPLPCVTRSSYADLAFCVASLASRQALSLPSTSNRRTKVRQRPPSCLQQPPPLSAGLPTLPAMRDQKQHLLPNTTSDSCGAVEPPRNDVRDVRVSEGGGSTSGGGDTVQTQKSLMDAGNRRRWTEVLNILGHWEEHADRLDVKTYNIALSALSKCGRWKEAIAMLDRMRAAGVPPDVYSWNGAITACGRAGQAQLAVNLLVKMEREGSEVRPDLFSYNGAMNAVAKAGRWTQALELLARIKNRGLAPDVISFSSAMYACDRAGKWQHALDILDLMRERNVEPNIITYGTAISACSRGGHWEKALSLLQEISSRGLTVNAHVYGSAVHACVVGKEPRRALALLEEMIERGVVPDAVVFTAAMTAVDGWAAALRLLEVMKRAGVLPDLRAYNAALSVVARSGREDVALALLDQMRIDGCSPDLVSFNTAIDACASCEKWQEALQLLEVDMPAAKVKPDVISFTSVIHACAGPKGNWEKAYQLLDGMWQDEAGAKPNKRTYDLAIQACGHGGEWELGVTLIDDMRDLGIKPDAQTFNIAATACGRSGERLAAETLVANMWRSGVTPDEFTYASLVAACGTAGQWKRATEIFDEARYVRNIPPSLQIYGALLSSLADAERWADISTYFDRMAADGIVPDASATNTGVLAAAKLGDGRRALSLLEGDTRRWRWRLNDEGDDSSGGKAEGAARREEREASPEVSESAISHAASLPALVDSGKGNERGRGGADAGVRSALGGGGWEAATPSLLNSVLHALDSAGEDAAVLEAVKRGREEGVLLNPAIYRCALKASGNLGDFKEAGTLLSQMAEENLAPDIVHWNHALRASAAGARWREARARLQEMQAADVAPDAFSYSMALKACSAGLWSADSWSRSTGWGPEQDGSPRICEYEELYVDHGATAASCRGRNAIELLQEMENRGVQVCGRSFILAMAACLEGHRDRHVEADLEGPPEADFRLAEAALSLFDQVVEAGHRPTGSTYALALKACARTANKHRASALLTDMLDGRKSPSPGTPGDAQAPIEVRPWHLASAVAAYDAAGDWDGARELWSEALRRGVSPRSPGYGAAIGAAVRAGDMTAAFRLVDEARGLNLELDARVVAPLARALEIRGERSRASELLGQVRGGEGVVGALRGAGTIATAGMGTRQ